MTRMRMLGLLLTWSAVVVVVGLATWVTIDSAGAGVGQVAAYAAGDSGADDDTPATDITGVSPEPTRSPTASPTPSGGPTQWVAVPRDTPSSPSTPRTTAPRTRTTPPPAAPPPVWAAFPSRGGTVLMTCRGGLIGQYSVSPRNGYTFEVEVEDGTLLKVQFNATDDEMEMRLVCKDGKPKLRRIR